MLTSLPTPLLFQIEQVVGAVLSDLIDADNIAFVRELLLHIIVFVSCSSGVNRKALLVFVVRTFTPDDMELELLMVIIYIFYNYSAPLVSTTSRYDD
mmetsp:Transcript_33470/g.48475  ORF Transcript_33470/g.48475 Transcript_33470/m.48475 type:complete len:97 (+) Transcript_33470:560-850(+)